MTTSTTNQQIVPVPSARSEPKSWSQAFVERAKAELAQAPPVEAMAYVRETAGVFGEFVEGGITGSLLGVTHARFGLDSAYGPADAWLAVVGAILGVAASGHFPRLAARARGVGSKSFTVLAFRKAVELCGGEPLMGGTASGVHRMAVPGKGPGLTKRDPIEEAADGIDGL